MTIPLYQADAFTDRLFAGNPAAVCILEEELPDALLLSIARENNLSETAYLRRGEDTWNLRWFTPGGEVNLCGHATLASGHIILTELETDRDRVDFSTVSGPLGVSRDGGGYRLDLPSWPGREVPAREEWGVALGIEPRAVRRTDRDIYCLLDSEEEVRAAAPDFRALARIELDGVRIDGAGIGAIGGDGDTVSRYFAPALGIDEDPVTGSAHSTWVPWLAELTGRREQTCRQLSARGGTMRAELRGERVQLIAGAVTYLRGSIELG